MSAPHSLVQTPPRSAYVYYRVPAAREAAVLGLVHQLFASLALAHPGLQTRLMCRVAMGAEATSPGAPTDAQTEAEATWMEVYTHPQGLSASCLAQMQDLAQTLLTDQTGARHLELFVPVDTAGSSLA